MAITSRIGCALCLALTLAGAVLVANPAYAAYLQITYTGELDALGGDDVAGLDGATFQWQAVFGAEATRYSTAGTADSFQAIYPITLTLAGTAGGANDGVYLDNARLIWELQTAVWDEYRNFGPFDINGLVFLAPGNLLVPQGFTGAPSATNTLTPVNTADVQDFGFFNGVSPDPEIYRYDVVSPQISTLIINAPVAGDDAYNATEDTQLVVPAPGVLGNDADADNNSLTAVLDTGTANGTLALNADGSFTYDPAANFCGQDSFTYHANDGVLNSNVATVSITVECVADPARFTVTKTYSDGNTDEVEVTLTCNSGLPLQQSFAISEGNPVVFVVTNFAEGAMTCEVTETGVANGYTPSYDNGSEVSSGGCTFVDVLGTDYSCAITNNADPATFTVYKEWVIEGAVGHEVHEEARVTIYCNNEIQGGGANGSYYYLSDTLVGDGDSLTATVDTTLQSAQCWAEEDLFESGVESANDCGSRSISAGGSSSCNFTNTVFFEGIPTLSQYGLAVLALLMLGVGLVGLRRFI